ncbi:hypothetical protein PGTUg99_016264 [Puccinia graminis f. sp. tritici]|uniref:Uncharacterized protein n=1 Tax=Puccinia graminis f. sp. tritici TaxID=56615 RepID=A0A5B0QKR7_PUCGR|nr:hypothetical protein PGTUg99_016264 [Puccinia graminis f. sp. tritici]
MVEVLKGSIDQYCCSACELWVRIRYVSVLFVTGCEEHRISELYVMTPCGAADEMF